MKRHIQYVSLVLIDVILISASIVGAIRLSDSETSLTAKSLLVAVLAAIAVKIITFIQIGFYKAVLRYASIDFLTVILKGTTIGTGAIILLLYFVGIHLEPRVFVIDWLITIILMGGSRFAIRYHHEFISGHKKGKKVLIYGAGDLGVMALRQLKQDRTLSYVPVGFIDDDAKKGNGVIQNMRVVGRWSELDEIIARTGADEIVVAISNISGDKMRRIVRDCRQRRIICRVVPSFPKVLEMEPMVRNIEISDLLRRAPRDLDTDAISRFLDSKRVLITGAAGSIGSELVKQCLKYNPDEIIAVDQSEEGLYRLKEEYGNIGENIRYLLADVVSTKSMDGIFDASMPHIVFHAAAYKHVPLLEDNLSEAVINNIGGTEVVARLSAKHGVEKFVLISTDKAVKPSSVMGATKRVAELLVQNFAECNGTEYVAVRFGNVLGSSGSVVPKFMEQIRSGGPVTVTHPEATRYFMLIGEAVSLVLQAASVGKRGEIYILDMGSPVKIADVAEDLIYLMGREPGRDIEIKYTGLRPGEKIYEELLEDEIDHKTMYENITVAKARRLEWDSLEMSLSDLLLAAKARDSAAVLKYLKHLVPEGSFGGVEGSGSGGIRLTAQGVMDTAYDAGYKAQGV